MNLTTEPWIPAVWLDGRPATVTLREAFERGHELQDLAMCPHERIALMRLLICVAQAALDGPVDHDDRESCLSRIAPAALLCYLDRWNTPSSCSEAGSGSCKPRAWKRYNQEEARERVGGDEENRE